LRREAGYEQLRCGKRFSVKAGWGQKLRGRKGGGGIHNVHRIGKPSKKQRLSIARRVREKGNFTSEIEGAERLRGTRNSVFLTTMSMGWGPSNSLGKNNLPADGGT